MTIQAMMEKKNMTMYRLAQISGLPKTTVLDICSGKSTIPGCTARTVQKLSQALGCTMEDLMAEAAYDPRSGLPTDDAYMEKGLPDDLRKSIAMMKTSWDRLDKGETDLHWDTCWSALNADINEAEVEQMISPEQAAYLRRKYLRMEGNV